MCLTKLTFNILCSILTYKSMYYLQGWLHNFQISDNLRAIDCDCEYVFQKLISFLNCLFIYFACEILLCLQNSESVGESSLAMLDA